MLDCSKSYSLYYISVIPAQPYMRCFLYPASRESLQNNRGNTIKGRTMTYIKNEAFIDTEPWINKAPVIMLPHSCDEWVIGSPEDARTLIADLEALIPELEKKLTEQ